VRDLVTLKARVLVRQFVLERKGTSRVYRGRDKAPRNASRYIIAIGQLYLLRRGGRRQTCLLREGGPHTPYGFSQRAKNKWGCVALLSLHRNAEPIFGSGRLV